MISDKIRGIIIRENFSGDADKYLVVFAKDIGKISIFAKGARNTKSKFLASSAVFTYADFIVNTTTKTPKLISADVIETFYNIRTNLDSTVYASFFTEFIDKALIENVSENNALLLLLKALQKLTKPNCNPRLIGCIFQLRLLDILGYSPNNETFTEYSLSETAIFALTYILSTDLNSSFNVIISTEFLAEIESFLEKFINFNLGLTFKSYKIIKDLILTN